MSDQKRYAGEYQSVGGCEVVVIDSDGDHWDLDPRFGEVRHSTVGFQWGYGGSGPAQLAYALVRSQYDRETTEAVYRDFKTAVVAQFPDTGWEMAADDIRSLVEHIQSEGDGK